MSNSQEGEWIPKPWDYPEEWHFPEQINVQHPDPSLPSHGQEGQQQVPVQDKISTGLDPHSGWPSTLPNSSGGTSLPNQPQVHDLRPLPEVIQAYRDLRYVFFKLNQFY